ncbi:HPr family phosphocarrier protein [Anaerosalibacter bizertensis]|uniref:Phosphocarrier protein HPr n=1 Tax=Anaerosalibacter bizertensis TaxID=932217 RepID=A0A844FF11_9FIRM|nr:HPr family phosphocarrier protein [Anaerosalibacter bizertensis]MBV1816528.1 HPr family phosphocarrier protein [Bacteroidales bacterium MSK.15.36]MBU5294550.1 HPr family phosphocarrier protein [Anaerosalibacter bizertensis]MCB5559371.1 HPr family phosphocarrier protein [Anaerosalibacter bizertensis]MCG4563915.1 HPr family phosphocarrier protein [Anaerosalibacter bizertensis]MCG4581547.1 HPr family phosphocarrier protein [Anaerosalibacter bizertensis]
MKSKKVVVRNEVGLHARPASLFVQTANKYLSRIYIELDGKRVNGKSIMGVMSLGIFQGEEITIIAQGEDEVEAIEDLVDLIENRILDA